MPKPKKDGRAIFRIQLTLSAKDRIEATCDEIGMTQIAMASRLMEWFASQPDTLKAAILGLYPGVLQTDVAELLLKRMHDEKKSTGNILNDKV